MKLINLTGTLFKTSKGPFKHNSYIDFEDEEARVLLKYKGIEKLEGLDGEDSSSKPSEYELLKKEAESLGIDFPGRIKKAALKELIEKAKEDAKAE
jgi:hypothetical protein